MAPRLAVAVLGWLVASGCGLRPAVAESASVGRANRGRLVGAERLPDRGPGFVRARPGERTGFGLPRLVGALERAAASVARRYPGTAPLRIGDLSSRYGGRHPRHGSHRSGRDADIIFYLLDATGRPVRGRGWLAFGPLGAAREERPVGGRPPSFATYTFDTARNWWLVRSLLADDEAAVQWIFVANPLKARLLAHAVAHEADDEIVLRASWVLHQPGSGNPHADHFHVRLLCTAVEKAAGCRDYGPVWPWLRKAHEKPERPGPAGDDDRSLLDALLEDG